jgi:hypothetical protein
MVGFISFADILNGLLTQSRDCQCCALSSSALLLTQSLSNQTSFNLKFMGWSASFHSPTSIMVPYPKPGLPMLRIVFLGIAPYPKPFKQTLRVCLAFLMLIRSIKQACFAASH